MCAVTAEVVEIQVAFVDLFEAEFLVEVDSLAVEVCVEVYNHACFIGFFEGPFDKHRGCSTALMGWMSRQITEYLYHR